MLLRYSAQVAIHSVLASRIFFNLRECDKQVNSFEDELSLDTLHYRVEQTGDISTQVETIPVT